ncbi:MAG TPA: phage portal protein [Streptosporangiaceae bacterium]|nr:phage portal protein [Streptosporangiaceae bacterium]
MPSITARLTEAVRGRPAGKHRNTPAPVKALPGSAATQRQGYAYGIPQGGLDENQIGIGTATGTDRQTLMQELYEAYLTCPWAWASVQAIARTITAGGLITDWDGDDGDGDKEVPDKPADVVALEALLDFVNPSQNIRQLLRNFIADLLVFGDAYLEVVWIGSRPVALYNQDSPTTTPVADEHGNVTGFVQVNDYGQKVPFDPRDIIHVSLDSARPGVLGVSPMQAARLPVTTWLMAAATGKEAFKKGLPPNIHADFPAATAKEEISRWRDQYFTKNIGAKNLGAPITTKGNATVKELQTGKIADVKTGKDQARDEILSIFGVPPAEAGVIESGNLGGGTGDSQHRTFEVNTCGPIAELVAEALTFHLAVVAFGISDWLLKFGEVDYRDSQVVEEIRDMRLRNGAWTLNKYRAEIGEPPVEGGDDAVLVDRQNLVLWTDLKAMSAATVASKGQTPPTPNEPGDPDLQDDPDAPGSAQQVQAKLPAGQKPAKGKTPAKTPAKPGKKVPAEHLARYRARLAEALRLMPRITEDTTTPDVAQQVHDQLSASFPADAIAWVLDADWSGPHPVPVDDVDTSDQDTWAASHDGNRIAKARKKLRKRKADGGHLKPLILVRTPGADKDMIADGHHRYLAAVAEGEPTVWAYVGRVDADKGDWDQMHSSQMKGNA